MPKSSGEDWIGRQGPKWTFISSQVARMVAGVSIGSSHPPRGQALSAAPPGTVTAGIACFAVVELLIALFMAIAPHAFYENVGPFGLVNDHYIRDLATYNAAIGVALTASIRRPSWRVPVLALTTIQYALHSVNHLVDIGNAHPKYLGYVNFFVIAIATALLAWLWRVAAAEERAR